MTHWQFLLASAALGFTVGCGGEEPAAGATSSTPTETSTESTTEAAAAPDVANAAPEMPKAAASAPKILTEAPTGTPTNFAEFCAAQRQALKDGTEALKALNSDAGDAEARANLEAALSRMAELEPLALTMTPPDAATAEAESKALTPVRDKFGAARLELEATPDGILLFREIQASATSGD